MLLTNKSLVPQLVPSPLGINIVLLHCSWFRKRNFGFVLPQNAINHFNVMWTNAIPSMSAAKHLLSFALLVCWHSYGIFTVQMDEWWESGWAGVWWLWQAPHTLLSLSIQIYFVSMRIEQMCRQAIACRHPIQISCTRASVTYYYVDAYRCLFVSRVHLHIIFVNSKSDYVWCVMVAFCG